MAQGVFVTMTARLTKLTMKDVHVLHRIHDTLDALQCSSYFSSMDLHSGYWQIYICCDDKLITLSTAPGGFTISTTWRWGCETRLQRLIV